MSAFLTYFSNSNFVFHLLSSSRNEDWLFFSFWQGVCIAFSVVRLINDFENICTGIPEAWISIIFQWKSIIMYDKMDMYDYVIHHTNLETWVSKTLTDVKNFRASEFQYLICLIELWIIIYNCVYSLTFSCSGYCGIPQFNQWSLSFHQSQYESSLVPQILVMPEFWKSVNECLIIINDLQKSIVQLSNFDIHIWIWITDSCVTMY